MRFSKKIIKKNSDAIEGLQKSIKFLSSKIYIKADLNGLKNID